MTSLKRLRSAPVAVLQSRWTAYATACAATALVGVYSAEGDITYSGPLNITVNAAPGTFFQTYIQLMGQPAGFSLNPLHIRLSNPNSGSGVARFFLYGSGAPAGSVAGFVANGFGYVSRLTFGQTINTRPFSIASGGSMAFRAGTGNSQWTTMDTGYIGFSFDSGSGTQFGWVQIRTDEGAPGNSYTVIDYAYGDFGDTITAGQQVIPEPGSLGLLALGGIGLVAWRRQRAKAAAAQA